MLNLTKEQDSPEINHLFRIQYVDQTYQLVNWTNDQLGKVYEDMQAGRKVIMMDKCIFKADDIRAITYLPPLPEEEPEEEMLSEENAAIVVTEMGAYEKDMYELLIQNGIDLGNVITEGKGGKRE